MEYFFVESGDFDRMCDSKYQIANAVWKDSVRDIVPLDAKHLVVNGSDNSLQFWSDTEMLHTVKVVGIILEDGTKLTKEG